MNKRYILIKMLSFVVVCRLLINNYVCNGPGSFETATILQKRKATQKADDSMPS